MTVTEVPAREDFARLADPYRRELLAHCYRMLGSVHDAEDLVQETYLRAWRAYAGFGGRSSLRTWLYRVATSACLTALENRSRRPLPTGLGEPSAPDAELVHQPELPWLQPIPDALVAVNETDPAAAVASRQSIRLAFVAAMQHLPPRQRAVLILRDVLRFRAAEVADVLGVTTAAVNSLLQRAREQIDQAALREDDVTDAVPPEHRALLDAYVAAFERYDIPAIVELLTAHAVWEMPPFVNWYEGAETIGQLIVRQCLADQAGDLLLIPTAANGQPAFGTYLRDRGGEYRPFQLQVLTISEGKISHGALFFDLSLFPTIGLPPTQPART